MKTDWKDRPSCPLGKKIDTKLAMRISFKLGIIRRQLDENIEIHVLVDINEEKRRDRIFGEH